MWSRGPLLVFLVLALATLGSAFSVAAPGRARAPRACVRMGEPLAAQLRAQSDDELAAQVDEAMAALYDFRHKRATRQTAKTSEYKAAQYKIALINTILSERQRA